MIFILLFMGWKQYVKCQTIHEVQDRLLHNTKFHEFYHGTAGSLKNEGAEIWVPKDEVHDANKKLNLTIGWLSTGYLVGDDFKKGDGELYVEANYMFLKNHSSHHQESPILFQVKHHTKNDTDIGLKDGADALNGHYLTNYWLITPQREFHEPLLIHIPFQETANFNKNYTTRIFVKSLAFDKKVETVIYDGWGFVTPNEKSGTYNISENHDGITFQTTVGGIFIVAQMDPDNDPFALIGRKEVTSGQRFWYSILVILLIVLCIGFVWRFWFKRKINASDSLPPKIVEGLSYFSWRNIRGSSTPI